MTHERKQFLAGVIEGFYGQPWSQAERFQLFHWMREWGLNTYFYAPKDDLKHRAIWRELYSEAEARNLAQLIQSCHQHHLRFVYALSPGLDIRYSQESELSHLKKRLEQLHALGCQDFSLLFDDIPDHLDAADIQRWGSLAAAQSHIANALFRWIRERNPNARFLFCPTPYCGRMAERKLGGEGYLSTIGRELLPEIDIFWTGPEIISREISVPHVDALQPLLRRKPVIWDNLHANDYDGRRFFCGPYAGRPTELRDGVNGILINPNTEFLLNYVPFRTFAKFMSHPKDWDARGAYLSAMKEWLPSFATVGAPVLLEDLILFGDCYYLPHEEGAEANTLCDHAENLRGSTLESDDRRITEFRNRATQLRDFCARMTELRNRPLFYALSRRIWELREELDLLERYVDFRSKPSNQNVAFTSDFHQPKTYRGGTVARLQQLLRQHSDGTLTPHE